MLYIFSWIILGTGSIHESLIAIIIARALVGIAVGLIMPAAQIYVSHKQSFLFFLYLMRNIYCIANWADFSTHRKDVKTMLKVLHK